MFWGKIFFSFFWLLELPKINEKFFFSFKNICNICFDDELSGTDMYTQYFNAHVTYCPKNLFNKETLHCCGIEFSNHDKRKLHIEAVHRQPQCIDQTEMASEAAVKEFLENKCLSTSLFVNKPITPFYKPPHKETVWSVNFEISG